MVENIETILKANSKKHTDKYLNIFWLGFTIYTGAFAMSTSTTGNYKLLQLFQIIGILMFIPSAIKLIKWKFANSYLKVLFGLYIFWQLTIVLRAEHFNYTYIKEMLFDAELGVFRFFAPLILLFPKNLLYYKKILLVIITLGVLFLLFDVMYIDNLMNLDYENTNTKFTYEHFVKILSVPSGIILLTFPYQNKRVKYLALIVIFVSVLFSVIRARRALLFLTISPLLFTYIIYLYTKRKSFFSMLFPLVLSLLILFYGVKDFSENTPEFFSLLSERATQDTRSGVERFFYRDMTTQDWIIGKGIDGLYFCPGIETGVHAIYRGMIETDYLNVILKGGLISLVLLLLMAVPAMIKGIFYSKNILSKAAGAWILLWILGLYPATVSTFSLHYLTFWMAIGICYSEVIRNIPERTLFSIFSTFGKKKTTRKYREISDEAE